MKGSTEKEVLSLIDSYWKFDNMQKPCSSWHEKQDLLDVVKKTLQSNQHYEYLYGEIKRIKKQRNDYQQDIIKLQNKISFLKFQLEIAGIKNS